MQPMALRGMRPPRRAAGPNSSERAMGDDQNCATRLGLLHPRRQAELEREKPRNPSFSLFCLLPFHIGPASVEARTSGPK
jgi:hypothetical protein